MQRDLELDKFIAEEVWGEKAPTHQIDPLWCWTPGNREGYSSMGQWIAHHDYEKGDVTEWQPAPNTGDVGYAISAMEWLTTKTKHTERKLEFRIVRNSPNNWLVHYSWRPLNSENYHSGTSFGDWLPLVICQAISMYFNSVDRYYDKDEA